MKGHIQLALVQYLEGTRGSQLDILARHALWQQGLNYGHGTGHGVGFFLNVHEGPQNIRMEVNPTPLELGMITSNEPGLYRSGKYGIRIENLVITELREETEFGRFFGFETVTICFLDNQLVTISLSVRISSQQRKSLGTMLIRNESIRRSLPYLAATKQLGFAPRRSLSKEER